MTMTASNWRLPPIAITVTPLLRFAFSSLPRAILVSELKRYKLQNKTISSAHSSIERLGGSEREVGPMGRVRLAERERPTPCRSPSSVNDESAPISLYWKRCFFRVLLLFCFYVCLSVSVSFLACMVKFPTHCTVRVRWVSWDVGPKLILSTTSSSNWYGSRCVFSVRR